MWGPLICEMHLFCLFHLFSQFFVSTSCLFVNLSFMLQGFDINILLCLSSVGFSSLSTTHTNLFFVIAILIFFVAQKEVKGCALGLDDRVEAALGYDSDCLCIAPVVG